jgi:alpha,alpha-trehalose phosphorylase
VGRHRDVATAVPETELDSWRRAAEHMRVPWDERLGVHPQSDGYTDLERWDFAGTDKSRYPLLLHYPYFDLYRRQVIKQADLVQALFVCGDQFTPEQKAADFDYYEALTVRDSSLSAAIQSVIAAETGHLDLAYDYWGEAALMDILDLEHNTRDGVHIAALAGAWIAAVNGFGGMRDHGDMLTFRPQLPSDLTRLAFTICWRDGRLSVSITPGQVQYYWIDAASVTFQHYGEKVTLASGEKRSFDLPEVRTTSAPRQPLHCEPLRRTR